MRGWLTRRTLKREAVQRKREANLRKREEERQKASADSTSQWVQYADESTGVPYWYNTVTGESSWETPHGVTPAPSAYDPVSSVYTAAASDSAWLCSVCAYEYATHSCAECNVSYCSGCLDTAHSFPDHSVSVIDPTAAYTGAATDGAATIAATIADSSVDAPAKAGPVYANFLSAVWLCGCVAVCVPGCPMTRVWFSLLFSCSTCAECEEVEATLTCVPCGDAFCDSCFGTTHAKGNKRTHTTTPVGSGADAPVNDAAPDMDDSWVQYVDEASGAPYWYNAETGESRWE